MPRARDEELSALTRSALREAADRGKRSTAGLAKLRASKRLATEVRAFERRWGGLSFGELVLGFKAADEKLWGRVVRLRRWTRRSRILVGVFQGWRPLYVDASGGLSIAAGRWTDAAIVPFATSAVVAVEREALKLAASRLSLRAELTGRFAGVLSAALDVPAQESASDEDSSWHLDPDRGLQIHDGVADDPNAPVTTVWARDAGVMGDALRAAKKRRPKVGAWLCTRAAAGTGASPRPTIARPSAAPRLGRGGARVRLARRTGARAQRTKDGGVLILRANVIEQHERHGRATVAVERFAGTSSERVEHISAVEELAPRLSEGAARNLERLHPSYATRDPRRVVPARVLRPILTGLGVDPRPALAFERAVGGLHFDTLRLGAETLVDVVEGVALGGSAPQLYDGRVLVGTIGSDGLILLDDDGRIHWRDELDGGDAPFADDTAVMLERWLRTWTDLAFPRPPPRPEATLAGAHGASIAAALGVPLAPELTDSNESVWEDRHFRIRETSLGHEGVHTIVRARGMREIGRLARALEAGTRATTRYTDVRARLERAGVAVDRDPEEAPFAKPRKKKGKPAAAKRRSAGPDREKLAAVVAKAASSSEMLADAVDALRSALDEEAAVCLVEQITHHPNASPKLLSVIAALKPAPPFSESLARAATLHPSAPRSLLVRSAHDRSHPEVRHAAAGHPRMPAVEMHVVAVDEDPHILAAAAANPAMGAMRLAKLASSNDARVRAAVARNLSSTPKILGALVADADRSVVFDAACNPASPSDVVDRALWRPFDIRWRYAEHPAVSAEMLATMASSDDRRLRRAIANHLATPVAVLVALLEDPTAVVRRTAMGHPRLPPAAVPAGVDAATLAEARRDHGQPIDPLRVPPRPTLAALLEGSRRRTNHSPRPSSPSFPVGLLRDVFDGRDLSLRGSAIHHPWIPTELLVELADRETGTNLGMVAGHLRTPAAIVARLSHDPFEHVRAAAARHPKLPRKERERLAAGKNKFVLWALARSPHTPPELLSGVAERGDAAVRADVAQSARTPVSVLERLASSAHPRVRAGIGLNPKAPLPLLERLLDDPVRVVREAAVFGLLGHRPRSAIPWRA